jgi:hypothetical protein
MNDSEPAVPPQPGVSRRTFIAQAAGTGALAVLAGCQSPAPNTSAPSPGAKEPAPPKIVARCGYRCDLCAARSDDPAVRQKLVDAWRKYYGHTQYTVENVQCGGCYSEKLADRTCKVRPCVIAKGIENCAHCDQCPCAKLKPLCSSPHINFVNFGEVPQEDYDLAMRQFDNVPELMRIRAQLRTRQRT